MTFVVTSGVLLNVLVGETEYMFELDYHNKLVDIQVDLSRGLTCRCVHNFYTLLQQKKASAQSVAIDTVKLLCECAQLEAPQDLRHAVFVLGAAPKCHAAVKEHLKAVRRTCLVDVDPSDFRRMEISFANGVCAVLRIHECYPQVGLLWE